MKCFKHPKENTEAISGDFKVNYSKHFFLHLLNKFIDFVPICSSHPGSILYGSGQSCI